MIWGGFHRWLLGGVIAALVSCDTTQVVPRPAGQAPTAVDFAARQEIRVCAISTIALRGHAEIRWKDESGSHFDDGDFDLVARPPSEMSLRVSKLGERILWVGAGGDEWWTVFPKDKPSRAILRPWTSTPSAKHEALDGSLADLIYPARIFESIGLAKVTADAVTGIDWDSSRGGWRFDLADRRIFTRGESLLPVECEWVDEHGAVVAVCELSAFAWPTGEREAGSRPLESQPLVATRIRIAAWPRGRGAQDAPAEAELLLSAETPSFGADRAKPQLFRWEDVARALRPEVIQGSGR